MSRSRWKNKERARKFEVTDALFDAVYTEGDQMLRDCMDLSTATGMRLTDCRTILLPKGDALVKAKLANDDEFARQIAAMYLRDMRKRASDLAGSEAAASALLQHADAAFTRKHYRRKAAKLTPVR